MSSIIAKAYNAIQPIINRYIRLPVGWGEAQSPTVVAHERAVYEPKDGTPQQINSLGFVPHPNLRVPAVNRKAVIFI